MDRKSRPLLGKLVDLVSLTYILSFKLLLRKLRNIFLDRRVQIQFSFLTQPCHSCGCEGLADAGDSHDGVWGARHTILQISITEPLEMKNSKGLNSKMRISLDHADAYSSIALFFPSSLDVTEKSWFQVSENTAAPDLQTRSGIHPQPRRPPLLERRPPSGSQRTRNQRARDLHRTHAKPRARAHLAAYLYPLHKVPANFSGIAVTIGGPAFRFSAGSGNGFIRVA